MLVTLRHLEGTDGFGLQNLCITGHKLGHRKILVINLTLSAGEAKETLWPKLWVQTELVGFASWPDFNLPEGCPEVDTELEVISMQLRSKITVVRNIRYHHHSLSKKTQLFSI